MDRAGEPVTGRIGIDRQIADVGVTIFGHTNSYLSQVGTVGGLPPRLSASPTAIVCAHSNQLRHSPANPDTPNTSARTAQRLGSPTITPKGRAKLGQVGRRSARTTRPTHRGVGRTDHHPLPVMRR
ncbi:hypothetical protein JCM18899A_27910 [Nocardioides sp. AN3]